MNKLKCLACGEILISRHRHDFQRCGCPQGTFVDGGDEYRRAGGKSLEMIGYPDENDPDKFISFAEHRQQVHNRKRPNVS